MGVENGGFPEGRRLNTWKEIAAYLGRDERTVKRWETTRNLPVRRMPSGPRSLVFAYEAELLAWLRGGAAEESVLTTSGAAAGLRERRTPSFSPTWRTRRFLAGTVGVGASIAALLVWTLLIAPLAKPLHERSVPLNREAASFYRAGVYEWQTRTPEGLTHAVDDFTQAIVHDPGFAPAYAGLAMCFDLLREYTTMAPEEAYPRAQAAAERAIALDPSLASAHAALAFADFYWSRDAASAKREFQRALALEPRDATIHHWFATTLMETGDSAGAVTEIERAEALDSESSAIRADKGLILYFLGRKAEAMALLERLEQAQPSFWSTHRYLAWMFSWSGDDAQYLAELGVAAKLRHDTAESAVAAAGEDGRMRGGHEGMLKAMLAEQKRQFSEGNGDAYPLAVTFALLGDATRAFDYLQLSLGRREAETVALGIDPSFEFLRKRGDFRALVSRAGVFARS